MCFRRNVGGAVLAAAVLVACATVPDRAHEEQEVSALNQWLEKQGSPFRFALTGEQKNGTGVAKKYVLGNPCRTAAGAKLQVDIDHVIGEAESQNGGVAEPKIAETRCVYASQSPLKIDEVWVVLRGNDKVAYTVEMSPDPRDGTIFQVRGPWGKIE